MYRTRKMVRTAGRILLDLLYPPRCPVCGGISPWNRDICPECVPRIPYVKGKRCRKCGKPVEEFETYCDDCRKVPHAYEEGRGAFLYNDVMKESMAGLKFKYRKEYGAIWGRLAFEAESASVIRWNPEVVVPVPIHLAKLDRRGYNQAEEIARPIASLLGVPLLTDLLIRKRDTEAMKSLTAAERRDNLKEAFAAGGTSLVPRSVLLVDDIYTTGATVDACSVTLKKAGVRQVYFLSVCIGQGFMVRY